MSLISKAMKYAPDIFAAIMTGGASLVPLALEKVSQAVGEKIGSKEDFYAFIETAKPEQLLKLKEAEVALQSLQVDMARIQAETNKGQTEINKIDQASGNMFQAGWRPFIGWVGAFALGWQYVLYPMLLWVWVLSETTLTAPPVLASDEIMALVVGMLGIAGMRSYDKVKGTDTKP